MAEVLVAGDTLVDFLPEGAGRLDEVERFAPRAGGSGANVAMGLGRLGRSPLFFTNVATDPLGDALCETLAECGVSEEFVYRDDDAQTTLALVSSTPDGEPTFAFYRDNGADTKLPPGGVSDAALAGLEWVHLTGVALSVEPSRTALLELLERARDQGCTVSIDPNVRPSMWPSPQTMTAVLRGALTAADVVITSREDLRAIGITGEDPAGFARAVCALGPHTALLTLGEAGAIAVGADESPLSGVHRHEGFEVNVVDTTGAGDAFDAATIAALASGTTDPERVLAAANATAAVTTTERGAVRALTGPEPIRDLVGELPWE